MGIFGRSKNIVFTVVSSGQIFKVANIKDAKKIRKMFGGAITKINIKTGQRESIL